MERKLKLLKTLRLLLQLTWKAALLMIRMMMMMMRRRRSNPRKYLMKMSKTLPWER